MTKKEEVHKALMESDKPLGPKEIAEITGTTENTVSQYLRELFSEGKITKEGHGQWLALIEGDTIPPQAAIVIRNPKTKKVWLTVEILARVRVHDRIDLEGGEEDAGPDYTGDWT